VGCIVFVAAGAPPGVRIHDGLAVVGSKPGIAVGTAVFPSSKDMTTIKLRSSSNSASACTNKMNNHESEEQSRPFKEEIKEVS
jgi:hypothetical protein